MNLISRLEEGQYLGFPATLGRLKEPTIYKSQYILYKARSPNPLLRRLYKGKRDQLKILKTYQNYYLAAKTILVISPKLEGGAIYLVFGNSQVQEAKVQLIVIPRVSTRIRLAYGIATERSKIGDPIVRATRRADSIKTRLRKYILYIGLGRWQLGLVGN